ncbi:uncharacterized protein MONBRDRAFT_23046 [Monosiga brevicollis MX1]|uniref:Phosphoinositide phospholipase C n=1 Tax=Monosiga brevicollis TaxID=81824 RepID=A9USU9_MONBE|nr:uncharacterized protein MONBRDRAFT_23046 [Monosiga brevicollis MX1]EDQ91840.1 predicted protein [Monosiga brevicollis MX1]|eukprot:XP_001743126.1 hypothetical protein [Monosiga brevicollis MX1]
MVGSGPSLSRSWTPITLQDFMEEEQGVTLSLEQSLGLLDQAEPDSTRAARGELSFLGFVRIMRRPEFSSIIDRSHQVVSQDMTQPWHHYWISSSHNTYVVNQQLDCWDGEDGEPEVTHAFTTPLGVHTLTTRVKFKHVVEAIRDSAFKRSEYPVILSLEDHCSLPQQAKIAQYFKDILGDLLLDRFLDLDSPSTVPSPEQLKRKILLKHKKLGLSQAEKETLVQLHDLPTPDVLLDDPLKDDDEEAERIRNATREEISDMFLRDVEQDVADVRMFGHVERVEMEVRTSPRGFSRRVSHMLGHWSGRLGSATFLTEPKIAGDDGVAHVNHLVTPVDHEVDRSLQPGFYESVEDGWSTDEEAAEPGPSNASATNRFKRHQNAPGDASSPIMLPNDTQPSDNLASLRRASAPGPALPSRLGVARASHSSGENIVHFPASNNIRRSRRGSSSRGTARRLSQTLARRSYRLAMHRQASTTQTQRQSLLHTGLPLPPMESTESVPAQGVASALGLQKGGGSRRPILGELGAERTSYDEAMSDKASPSSLNPSDAASPTRSRCMSFQLSEAEADGGYIQIGSDASDSPWATDDEVPPSAISATFRDIRAQNGAGAVARRRTLGSTKRMRAIQAANAAGAVHNRPARDAFDAQHHQGQRRSRLGSGLARHERQGSSNEESTRGHLSSHTSYSGSHDAPPACAEAWMSASASATDQPAQASTRSHRSGASDSGSMGRGPRHRRSVQSDEPQRSRTGSFSLMMSRIFKRVRSQTPSQATLNLDLRNHFLTDGIAAKHAHCYQTVEELARFGHKQPNVHPSLSNLIIYTRAVKFSVFATRRRRLSQSRRRRPRLEQDVVVAPDAHANVEVALYPHEMCSFEESQAFRLTVLRFNKLLEHHLWKCSRVYPAGRRIDSSNFNPLIPWSAGCQMLAMNWQHRDVFQRLYHNFFSRLNGGCGFVLKPIWMRDPQTLDRQLNSEVSQSRQIGLTVMSALNLPMVDAGYSVEVQLFSASQSQATGSFSTLKVYGQAPNADEAVSPVWMQSTEFTVDRPAVAMLCFRVVCTREVVDEMGNKTLEDVSYETCFPVAELLQGYRTISFDPILDRLTGDETTMRSRTGSRRRTSRPATAGTSPAQRPRRISNDYGGFAPDGEVGSVGAGLDDQRVRLGTDTLPCSNDHEGEDATDDDEDEGPWMASDGLDGAGQSAHVSSNPCTGVPGPNGLPFQLNLHINIEEGITDKAAKLFGPYHRWLEQATNKSGPGDPLSRRRRTRRGSHSSLAVSHDSGGSCGAGDAALRPPCFISLSQFIEVFNAHRGRPALLRIEPGDRLEDVVSKTLLSTNAVENAGQFFLAHAADYARLPASRVGARASVADAFVLQDIRAVGQLSGQVDTAARPCWLVRVDVEDGAGDVANCSMRSARSSPSRTSRRSSTRGMPGEVDMEEGEEEEEEAELQSRAPSCRSQLSPLCGEESSPLARANSAISDYMRFVPGGTSGVPLDAEADSEDGPRQSVWQRIRDRLSKRASKSGEEVSEFSLLRVTAGHIIILRVDDLSVMETLSLLHLENLELDSSLPLVRLDFKGIKLRLTTSSGIHGQLIANTIAYELLRLNHAPGPDAALAVHYEVPERDELDDGSLYDAYSSGMSLRSREGTPLSMGDALGGDDGSEQTGVSASARRVSPLAPREPVHPGQASPSPEVQPSRTLYQPMAVRPGEQQPPRPPRMVALSTGSETHSRSGRSNYDNVELPSTSGYDNIVHMLDTFNGNSDVSFSPVPVQPRPLQVTPAPDDSPSRSPQVFLTTSSHPRSRNRTPLGGSLRPTSQGPLSRTSSPLRGDSPAPSTAAARMSLPTLSAQPEKQAVRNLRPSDALLYQRAESLDLVRLASLSEMPLSRKKAMVTAVDALSREQTQGLEAMHDMVAECIRRIAAAKVKVPHVLPVLRTNLHETLKELRYVTSLYKLMVQSRQSKQAQRQMQATHRDCVTRLKLQLDKLKAAQQQCPRSAIVAVLVVDE